MAERLRHDLHEVLVALVVLRQQHQVPHVLILIDVFIKTRARRRVNFAADDWFNPLLVALTIKIDDAEHDAVVGDGQGIHSQLLRPRNNVLDPGSTVQQTVFRMYVQMCKSHTLPLPMLLMQKHRP